MLKLRDFWILIALVSFAIGIYDFIELKQARQSGYLIQEARLRADAYTEIGFGVGSIIIYELAAINAKLKESKENLQLSHRNSQNHLPFEPTYTIQVLKDKDQNKPNEKNKHLAEKNH